MVDSMTAKVLYLDYDGVLHPADVYWQRDGASLYEEAMSEGHRLFAHAALLDKLLAPYGDVVIVLSTTWALNLGHAVAAKRLPRGLRERVIDGTYRLHMDEAAFRDTPRGRQVLTDVAYRQPRAWLALDDDEEGWGSALEENVVLCDRTLGVSEDQTLKRLATMLERFRA
ncbi:MAG: hypothetical protein KF891_05160 [Rhizobacter sp.]|nr:hypothetical protein [Rhizobacter sp.]